MSEEVKKAVEEGIEEQPTELDLNTVEGAALAEPAEGDPEEAL